MGSGGGWFRDGALLDRLDAEPKPAAANKRVTS